MIKPAWFFCVSAALMAGVIYLSDIHPADDLFSKIGNGGRIDLNGLSNISFVALKREHARQSERYDVGIFGNSRSMDIAKTDLNLEKCRFFNFSIGGSSLRTSAAFLELLAADGTIPRISIVSVDNFELQRYNNPLSMAASVRWPLLFRDLWNGLSKKEIPFREFIKMGWRHALSESIMFRKNFIPEFFLSGVKFKLGLQSGQRILNRNDIGYRSDGSRTSEPIPLDKKPTGILTPGSPQILLGYLEYDLKRFKRLQDQGIQLLLYETLIEPKSAKVFTENPTPYAAASRASFLSLCTKLSLRCYSAPKTPIPPSDRLWSDLSHPPAEISGAQIMNLLPDDMKHCNRDI